MFTTCHIGARGGNKEWPFLDQFEDDCTHILIDADSKSMEELKKIQKTKNNNEHIFSFVIGGKDKNCELFHTLSPYLTSTKRPKISPNSWNLPWFGVDYNLNEAAEIIKTEIVVQRKLKSLFEKELNHLKPPDFLSLDTQGSELEILKGAEDLLYKYLVGIVTEVEFHELYEKQPLFGDLCNYLKKQNFYFVGFRNLIKVAPYRYQLGLRGQGFDFTANALFLLKPELISISNTKKLLKLAFCSTVFCCFELTWRCFDILAQNKFWDLFIPKTHTEKLLYDLYQAYIKSPIIFPITIKQTLEGMADPYKKCLKIDMATHPVAKVFQKYSLTNQLEELIKSNTQN